MKATALPRIRTVFISSHLLSEMALTADRLIVIGRGRLVADTSTAEFIREHSASTVVVRSERLAEFAEHLTRAGLSPVQVPGPALEVADATTEQVGSLAFTGGFRLQELSMRQASLEDAFMDSTGAAVQYHARKAAG